jgi:hypothetical protein
LSSAILYIAIVAIWAVVLVPRWLRPSAAPPQPVPVPAESPDAEVREPAGPGQDAGVALAVSTDGPAVGGEAVGGEAVGGEAVGGEAVGGEAVGGEAVGGEAAADVSGEDARGEEAAPEPAVAAPSPVSRRAEVLKARRRLLSTLIALTVVAVGLAVTHIDAYWIVIPPTVLLTGYVVLLREFAHIDAARARRAEVRARAGQEPVPAATPAAANLGSDAPAAPGGAEIIDISGRVGDQVYDQYSDAANQAVGD